MKYQALFSSKICKERCHYICYLLIHDCRLKSYHLSLKRCFQQAMESSEYSLKPMASKNVISKSYFILNWRSSHYLWIVKYTSQQDTWDMGK